MQNQTFRLETSFDSKTGAVAAAYFRIDDGIVAETLELEEGIAYADYSADGLLLGIELLGPCKLQILDEIAQKQPEPVRRFFPSWRGASRDGSGVRVATPKAASD